MGKLPLHFRAHVAWLGATGLTYFFAAWFALHLPAPEGVAQFWPAAGVSVGALLIFGKSSRLPLAAGIAAASLLANGLAGRTFPACAAFALGNAGAALLVAALIERWFEHPFELDRFRNVLGLFGAAAIGSATTHAITAVLLELSGSGVAPLPALWARLVWSNITGIVLMAPLLLGLAAAVRKLPPLRELFEGAVILFLHAMASLHALALLPAGFGHWMIQAPFTSQMPLLLWLSVRCGTLFAAAGSLVLGLAALGSFQLNRGRFADPAFSLTERLISTDFAMLATAFVALSIAALIAERKDAERRRDERLRFVTERARVGHWDWEIKPDRHEWSPLCKQLMGVAPGNEPLSYTRFLAAVHPEDRERTDLAVRACLEWDGERAYDIEHRTLWPDGTVRWIHAKGSAIFDGNRPVRMAGIALDITDRKRAEELLRESEERLRLAQEAALAGSWEWALDDGLNIWSNSLWDLYGLTPGQCEPSFESWASSIHPDDRGQAAATVRAAAAAGREFEIQWRVNLPDGEPVRWLLSRGRPVAGANGAPERYLGIVMDITARKQAEAELERMRIMLAEGERIAHLGSFEYIAATEETVWSDEEKRIYGLDPAGPSPVYKDLLRHHIHPDDAAEMDRNFREALRNGAAFEHEKRIVRPDGSIRWTFHRAHPYFDSAGKLVKYIGATLDITDRKRREEQIELLLREVNHRAKNMLTLVQAVARQTVASDPGDFLERFSERVQALAASQDLLVKSGWQGVELGELVRSQLAHFKDLIGSRIELLGPPLAISASAAQPIGMAFHELATNAGKYGALANASGRITIAWSVKSTDGNEPDFTMIWRERGGPPVKAPARQGFGTAVMCEMTEMSLSAEVGLEFAAAGLTWQLRCPAKEILDESQPLVSGSAAAPPVSTSAPARSGPAILVVEDEPLVALEIAHVLKREGFDIVGPARTLAQGLQLLRTKGCDAAVLDINLGKETSELVALELKERGTPFVTLSGYTPAQHPPAFLGAPALVKPLRPDVLVAEVRRCVEPEGQRPAI